ncbi:MAG: 4Fe-4S dicluster domain-containing protein [Chloroflexi bacterium]|nr:4Fe-4S dicluster domain-containing protein [Chloroflexota bacterium]
MPAQPAARQIIPPSQGPLRRNTHAYDLMRQCIHCGFCLPTCPTYAVLGVEMDSPRGRIYQMQAVAEGRLEISDDFIEHMYCCVGCRACETACPSGVQFGKLIEAAREQIQLETDVVALEEGIDSHGTNEYSLLFGPTFNARLNSLAANLVRRFFFDLMLPSRLVLSLVFAGLKIYQRSGLQTLVHRTGLLDAVNNLPTPFQGKLKVPEELMHDAQGDLVPNRLPEVTPAIGHRRYRVGFVSGCIMDQVFHDINEATIRVLTANGCEVITPPQQNCCGALHVHGGEAEHGRALARHNIDVFEPYNCDAIIINSAGCGSTLKEYDHLLRDDPAYASRAQDFSHKVKDISEFLASIEWNRDMGEIKHTVVYHDACHLAHGQKIRQQPRQLLKAIPGMTLVDLKEADWCCGSAGIYNITNQEMATELLERKMNNIVATGANIIATGNPGCMMQIAMGVRERGLPMKVLHLVELLDEAYRAGGLYNLPAQDIEAKQKQQRTLLLGIGIGVLLGAILLRRRWTK